MNSEQLVQPGRCFYGTGIIGLGIQQFFYADWRPVFLVENWPMWLHNSFWGYLSATILVIAGVLILINKNARRVSVILGGFLIALFFLFQVPYTLFVSPNSPIHLGVWINPLKELALAGGAFIIASYFLARSGSVSAAIMNAVGRIFFGTMLILFGISHFYYVDFVQTLVPSWIPGHLFWTYFAGVALIGSGIAVILNLKIKTIAILLGIMLFLWLIGLHIPRAVTDPYGAKGNEVTSVFQALAFSGIAFVIAGMQNHKRIS